jgi:hypothetical protein
VSDRIGPGQIGLGPDRLVGIPSPPMRLDSAARSIVSGWSQPIESSSTSCRPSPKKQVIGPDLGRQIGPTTDTTQDEESIRSHSVGPHRVRPDRARPGRASWNTIYVDNNYTDRMYCHQLNLTMHTCIKHS